jgi:hypothetical protein
MKYQIWELKDFQKGNTNETTKENFVLLVNETKPDIELPTLQSVLDNNHDLIDGINSQGNNAGLGNTGYDINAFGYRAAKDNSGDDVNALGDSSAINNSGSRVNAIGSSSSNNNTGDRVNALGGNSASNNTGDNINAIGNYSAFNNSGNNVNALGNASAQNNTFNNVNLFGDNTQADEDGQTVFAKTFEIFARLSTSLLTATRKYILPNESGTIALQSYVDAQTGTPTLQEVTSQGNTTTDSINFGGTGINSDSNTNVGAGLVSGITYIGGVQKTFSLSGQQLTLGTSQLSTNVGVGTVRVIDNTDSSTQITTNGLILRETGRSGKIHAPNTGAATFQNDYYLPSATSYPAVRTLATENYVDAKLNPTLNVLPKKGANDFVDSAISEDANAIILNKTADIKGSLFVNTGGGFNSSLTISNNASLGSYTALNYLNSIGQFFQTGMYNSGGAFFFMVESKPIDFFTDSTLRLSIEAGGAVKISTLLKLGQFTTATEPAYVKGASFFNTTLNKSKIGGETIYETQITGTGTIGKIQKTNAEGVIGDSLISENGTNLIIGNPSLSHFLFTNIGDISSKFDNSTRVQFTQNHADSFGAGYGANGNGGFRIGGDAAFSYITASGTDLLLQAIQGRVGIRTITPTEALDVNGSIKLSNLLKLGQFTTATEPAYVKGASFFNTTLNKMRIGGATAYETVTSS